MSCHDPDQLEDDGDRGTERSSFVVVGIGASAGGLEPVSRLLGSVRTDSGMAYAVIQHLDPALPSQLVVAHDFNNLLTVIGGYGEMLLSELPESSRSREFASEIVQAGARATSLTRQLLAFRRKQVLSPRVVSEMEKMLRRLIGEDVSLVTRLDPDVHLVEIDPGQLEQVVMNLVVNSRDAMPHGGCVTIETGNLELDESLAWDHGSVPDGDYVVLSVSDTGTGMDADTRSHAFEPFFTTKEQGKGTGLGLATVHGIVKQSGGDIHLYSEPGRGATFKIYLPRARGSLTPSSARMRIDTGSPGSGAILLVEDEEGVRRLASSSLAARGYEVIAVASAADALAEIERRGDSIDLLLSDVVMPGMSGPELAIRVHESRPGMRVLFMSGYSRDVAALDVALGGQNAFLEKPFTPSALARKVREVLGSPGGVANVPRTQA